MVPECVSEGTCRDADDLPILGLAQAASADCIVTGDKDLLVLGRFGKIPIYSPRKFADILR
jgi:predicted nucleic acid-binding protein